MIHFVGPLYSSLSRSIFWWEPREPRGPSMLTGPPFFKCLPVKRRSRHEHIGVFLSASVCAVTCNSEHLMPRVPSPFGPFIAIGSTISKVLWAPCRLSTNPLPPFSVLISTCRSQRHTEHGSLPSMLRLSCPMYVGPISALNTVRKAHDRTRLSRLTTYWSILSHKPYIILRKAPRMAAVSFCKN